jgi:hypothetical protein
MRALIAQGSGIQFRPGSARLSAVSARPCCCGTSFAAIAPEEIQHAVDPGRC